DPDNAGEGHVLKPSRVAVIAAAVALSAVGSIVPVRAAAPPAATPDSRCHAGDRPEATQGRAPAADYTSGRAALGYFCNAREVSIPSRVLSPEGSFASDGNTYYSTPLFAHTIATIDVTNPQAPTPIWISTQCVIHGLNVSDDGNTLYAADDGSGTKGLLELD